MLYVNYLSKTLHDAFIDAKQQGFSIITRKMYVIERRR